MRKTGKRPTRKQKDLLKSRRLQPENWLVRKDTPTYMEIVNRQTGRVRVIEKVSLKSPKLFSRWSTS